MKIYTKKGDNGSTSLFGGQRISKAHIRVEAYGNVDELNAWIALLRDLTADPDIRDNLLRIENELFVVGGMLATPSGKSGNIPVISRNEIEQLEKEIDAMNERLPVQKHFILPGGHPAVSTCHIARNVCRRTERRVVQLQETESVFPVILEYLNRLSDYLFVLARKLSVLLNVKEMKWTH